MYEPSREFMSFHVAGFSHWYGLEVADELKPGTSVSLVAEPDNPYDPQAVAVMCGTTKIGYVPADINAVLSQLLFFGHGGDFEARISQVNLIEHPEHQVRVMVFVVDAR
jgi:hypothetical protein